jgi:5-methylcytosine-specific restriction endonuclease McrA
MDGKYLFIETASEEHIKKEKARARKLRHSAWWKRKKAQGVCYYCGRKVGPQELTMDHIVPLSRGGKSVRSNIVPCCKQCNNKKKYLLPVEWQEYLQSLKRPIDE